MPGAGHAFRLNLPPSTLEAASRGVLIAFAALAVVLPPPAPEMRKAEAQEVKVRQAELDERIGEAGTWQTLAVTPAGAAAATAATASAKSRPYGSTRLSPDATMLLAWVGRSGDHQNNAFVIVDKKFARVHVFDANAALRASSPVLLGAAKGDDSVAGIGTRPIAAVRPQERTTPAGRFVAERGRNTLGEDVVWVDYDAAVSMHRVRATNPKERRLERLASPWSKDNRISYGCINVPVKFFERFIQPVFAQRPAIVYVLPERKSARQVFGLPATAATL